jgi:hypothetical protein
LAAHSRPKRFPTARTPNAQRLFPCFCATTSVSVATTVAKRLARKKAEGGSSFRKPDRSLTSSIQDRASATGGGSSFRKLARSLTTNPYPKSPALAFGSANRHPCAAERPCRPCSWIGFCAFRFFCKLRLFCAAWKPERSANPHQNRNAAAQNMRVLHGQVGPPAPVQNLQPSLGAER